MKFLGGPIFKKNEWWWIFEKFTSGLSCSYWSWFPSLLLSQKEISVQYLANGIEIIHHLKQFMAIYLFMKKPKIVVGMGTYLFLANY